MICSDLSISFTWYRTQFPESDRCTLGSTLGYYARLKFWYTTLPTDQRRSYRRKKAVIDLLTALGFLGFVPIAWLFNSAFPLLVGVVVVTAVSYRYTIQLRRRFGFYD